MPVLIPPRLSPATLMGLFGLSGFPTFHSMILVVELSLLVINPISPPGFWNPPLEIFVVPPPLVVIPPINPLPLLSIVMFPESLVIVPLTVPSLLRLSRWN